MAFQKINKKFVLSDSSLNVYGMKLLTSGYQLSEYAKNPIGYYGHKYEEGVLLKWDDIQLDGDNIVGYPCINMEHPRGARTVSEIQEGFLNSASVGKLCILDYHLEDNAEDPKNPVIVVTRWYNKECSLVDNPGNRHAMKTELFDVHGSEINLEDITNEFKLKNKPMEKLTLTFKSYGRELLELLSLDDNSTDEMFIQSIRNIKAENVALSDYKTKTEAELKLLREKVTTNAEQRIKAICIKGLADKKFTKQTADSLEKEFAGKPDELAALVDTMQPYQSIAEYLKKPNGEEIKLADMTWDEIDKKGLLKELKQNHPDLYSHKLAEMQAKRKRK